MNNHPAMSKPFPGFSTPAAGPESPLEMLAACHKRIRHQCATLLRLLPHLATHGADEEARTAAAQVIRYFETSGKQHHQDEEEDLFPALIESMAGSDAVCLHEITEALQADHQALETAWVPLRDGLMQIANGDNALISTNDVETWAAHYEQHIQREEDVLLPMAARLLSEAALEHIGRAMCARRGLTFPQK
ncbi:MAG: hemerythrin domain-containing protein [Rugosibacter sp.]|nr:hemerythrin domain-containing protein [Rugosibacter sp.]